MNDFLLSQTEAAKFLSMSPKTLAKWRWSGEGPPFVKLGRSVRYLHDDLIQYVNLGRRKSTSETEFG